MADFYEADGADEQIAASLLRRKAMFNFDLAYIALYYAAVVLISITDYSGGWT